MTDDELRMDAYYYGFDPTGERVVDRVLSAVACAGKAYHHTEAWGETNEFAPYEPFLRGESCVLWIQNAAADAARELSELRHERDSALSLAERYRVEVEGMRPVAEAAVALRRAHINASGPYVDPAVRSATFALRKAVDAWRAGTPPSPRTVTNAELCVMAANMITAVDDGYPARELRRILDGLGITVTDEPPATKEERP